MVMLVDRLGKKENMKEKEDWLGWGSMDSSHQVTLGYLAVVTRQESILVKDPLSHLQEQEKRMDLLESYLCPNQE